MRYINNIKHFLGIGNQELEMVFAEGKNVECTKADMRLYRHIQSMWHGTTLYKFLL